ncbi:alpha/beta hydrolase [Geodermatophilus sp. SYSU D00691]
MVSEGVLADERRPRRRGRRAVVVLGVLALLAVVLLGGAGWYYSGEIHSGAFEVDPDDGPQRYDLVVDSYTDRGVVLRPAGDDVDRDPLTTAGTFGLVWDGGSAVVSGEPEDLGDGRVLRVFDGAVGPEPGTPAALVGRVWDDPRQAWGAPYEEVAVPCGGGECPAWFLPSMSSTWFVAVHGKGADRAETLRAVGPAVTSAGLPALVITYRNDPEAPADPSGRYAYGATEWRDLEAAVRYAVEHGAEDVVLYGSSMGGGIVAAFLQNAASASLVRGVVLDAPMLDLRATVAHGAAQRDLPVVGGVPDVLTGTAQWIAGWRYDLDWDAVDYLPGDWLTVPALVFHGTADDLVPPSTTEELRAAHPELVEEVRVEGAGHVRAWNTDRDAYESREVAFLGCVTAPEPAAACPGAGLREVTPSP